MNEYGFNVFDSHITAPLEPLFYDSERLLFADSGSGEHSSEDFYEDNIDNTPDIDRDGDSNDIDYSSQIEYISTQLDLLNENVSVTNENLKLGISFLFVVIIYLMVKIAFGIFNKILGLNQL